MERQGSIVDLDAVNLRLLLETASKRTYRSYDEDSINWNVVRQCQALFDKDYECEIVSNKYGELCGHYPSRMIVPVRERSLAEDTSVEPRAVFQPNSNLIDLMKEARLARCRCRLVCPVILLDGKYVCRSATVAGLPEVYGRSGLQFLTRKLGGASSSLSPNSAQQLESNVIAITRRSSDPETSEYDIVSLSDAQSSSPAKKTGGENPTEDVSEVVDPSASEDSSDVKQSASAITVEPRNRQERFVATDRESKTSEFRKAAVARQNVGDKIRWPYVDRLRDADCHLLKTLHVGTIYDLMLQRRKRKLFFSLTTSEKADGEDSVYAANFNIVAVPFPGREFFAEWRARDYVADSLRYDWHADPEADVSVSVPPSVDAFLPRSIDWSVYEEWNMVELTRNYFESMLATQVRSSGGVLVHCISGWDRTPLFVSLLRLSLWADRVVHASLDAEQITFLTLAYDWYLFGHALNERLHYGEEILFFGFQFLQFIADDSFSYYTLADANLKDQHQRERPQAGERAARLKAVRELFTDLYTTVTLSSSVSESSSPRYETDAEADEPDGDGHEKNTSEDRPATPDDATDGTSAANRLQASMPAVSNAVTGALSWAQRFVSNLYN